MAYLPVIEKIRAIAGKVADMDGVELVDLEIAGKGRRSILKVIIDREGGVTLKDCETVSRDIEALLDVEDPIAGAYTLEVSSPGLDRPLRSLDDFRRFAGKKARVVLEEPVDGQSFFVGAITGVEDETVLLDTGKQTYPLPFGRIKKARLEIEIKK